MIDKKQDETLITRYLLGRVSAEERAEIEDRYIRNDDWFEEVVAAENDLIDAYVRGKLATQDQARCETYFLSTPERRERIQFAKSLMASGSALGSSAPGAAGPQSRWPAILAFRAGPGARLHWALATLLVMAIAGFSWMVMINRKLHRELAAARDSQRETQALRQKVADLQAQAAAGQNPHIVDLPSPGTAVLSLTLAPHLVRGHGQRQETLYVSPDISEVLLLLEANNDGGSLYRVLLETAEGRQLLRKDGLTGQPTRKGSNVITVQVSPGDLGGGDYVLRLFRASPSGEETATYGFRVVRPKASEDSRDQ